eukprot:2376919-Heterocapsa_arctica.AAC.1
MSHARGVVGEGLSLVSLVLEDELLEMNLHLDREVGLMDLAYLIQDGIPTLFRHQHVLLDPFSCTPQLGPQLGRS